MAETENGLQELLTSQAESSRGYGLQINRNKTKVLVCTRNGSEDPLPKITVNGEPLECVTEYVYLGSLITQDIDCSPEIRRRINLASQTMGMLKTIWRSRDISLASQQRWTSWWHASSPVYYMQQRRGPWKQQMKTDFEHLKLGVAADFWKYTGLTGWQMRPWGQESEERRRW